MKRGVKKGDAHEISVGNFPNYGAEKAHLSSFINRFFNLSSSLALTIHAGGRTSYERSRVAHQRRDKTNAQLDLLSISSMN